jgi:hypothetical protein
MRINLRPGADRGEPLAAVAELLNQRLHAFVFHQEALIATAFGLFAAIPALFFYNYFSQRIREIRARMDDFSLEFFNLAERNYGEADGVLEPERATTRGLDR